MHLTRFVWLWQQQIVKTTTETSCNKYTLYNKNEKNTRQVGLFTGNFARRWILRKKTCCPSSGYFVYDFHSALVNFLVFSQHTHNIENTHRCTAFFFWLIRVFLWISCVSSAFWIFGFVSAPTTFFIFVWQAAWSSFSICLSLALVRRRGWLRGPVNRMRAYRVFELLASSCANQLSEGARSDERSFQRRA